MHKETGLQIDSICFSSFNVLHLLQIVYLLGSGYIRFRFLLTI